MGPAGAWAAGGPGNGKPPGPSGQGGNGALEAQLCSVLDQLGDSFKPMAEEARRLATERKAAE
eukprot:694791-Lingulodinium_polyedra.AAC.1